MKLKQLISGFCAAALLLGQVAFGQAALVRAQTTGDKEITAAASVSVDENGFDSDSIVNKDSDQWRWLGYPESRMVFNYGQRGDAIQYKSEINLQAAFVVNGFQTKNGLGKIQMGPKTGDVGNHTSISTAWYPYKLTADAVYSVGKLHMDEFFADKDTFVRYLTVSDATDAKLKVSADISGIVSNNALLIDQTNYWMVYKFLKVNADGTIASVETPVTSGSGWSWEVPLEAAEGKYAFSLTFLPKNVEDNTADKAFSLANETIQTGKNLDTMLAATKQFWDEKLAKVPAPTEFGVEGNKSNASIDAETHRRAFYAAWAFQYQNIVEPTPEKDYDYYQVTLGMASTWAHGASSAPNSCSWESLFDIQALSYVEPEIAWNAMEGFIYSIDENGILDGECLPSQKAHTTWVCYQNMLKAFPNKKAELDAELKELYSYLRRYLFWRADNPRWIYGGHNYENEKDISFVTQWYSDVDYAIKIADILEEYDDVALFEKRKAQMGEDCREWFFAEYDPSQPDSEDNRIMAFCFLNENGNSYSYSSHDSKADDAMNYVYEALYADLPKDLIDKLAHSYLAYINTHEDDPLLGFQFYKYGDGCYTAYGLQERELQYSDLAGKWEQYVNAILCNAIKNVDFAECLRVSGTTTKLEGVEPSSFNASAIIDYTYMKNGYRIDMGEFVLLGGDSIAKTGDTDVDVYTLKGTKPELPKTVTVEKDGETYQALVVWPDVAEGDYSGDKDTFNVTGTIYGTELKAIATVHVYSGTVTVAARTAATVVGEPIYPETTVPAVYTGTDGNEHHCVVEIKWGEDETVFDTAGTKTINGTIQFNGQKITAEILVLNGPKIISEDELYQYDTMQLKLENGDNPGTAYKKVQWKLAETGYDDAAGISSNGNLLAVKPGEVTVEAVVEDDEGEQLTARKVITIKGRNIVTNAYGAEVSASGTEGDSSSPEKAIDLKETTWWRAKDNNDGQWFQLKLKETATITGMKIRWYEGNQPRDIRVSVSNDGQTWQEVYARTSGISSGRDNYSEIFILDAPVAAQYIRMESGKAGDNKPGIVEFEVYSSNVITQQAASLEVSSEEDAIMEKGASLQLQANILPNTVSEKRVEWIVTDLFGQETKCASVSADGVLTAVQNGTVVVTARTIDGSNLSGQKTISIKNQDLINVALKKPATAGTNSGEAYKAVDGDMETRWGSSQNPSQNWFQVDLQGEYAINTFILNFEVSHAKDFELQVSEDGTNWQTVTAVQDNSLLNWRFTPEKPVIANYVKVDVSRPSSNEWGFSIWEFEIYGRNAAVDWSDWEAAMEQAESYEKNKDLYTSESYQNLADAMAEARGLLEKENVTQDEVDTITEKLLYAIGRLLEKGVVDKRDLKEAIDAANSLKAEDYTEESYQNLLGVLERAEALYSNDDAEQDDIDAMTTSLNGAISALVEKPANPQTVNKAALNTLIAEAEEKVSADYTAATWIKFEEALEDAKRVANDDSATQADVDQAAADLQSAIDDLQSIADETPEQAKESLSASIESVKGAIAELNESDYTEEAWKELQDALTAAETLLEDDAAETTDINNAEIRLLEAMEALPLAKEKKKLETLIAEAKEKVSADYTAATWIKFEEALEDAERVANDDSATLADVDQAATNLQSAIDNLQSIADETPEQAKESLSASVESVKGAIAELNESDYTEEAWKELQDALTAAETLLEDDAAETTDINNAEIRLLEAMEALPLAKEKKKLETLIASAEKLQETDYTSESWADFSEKLDAAKGALKADNATIESLSTAYDNLDAAMNALERVQINAVDKTALNAAITAAGALQSSAYTTESWNEFQAKLDAARAVAAKENASQSEVDEALKALNTAQSALKTTNQTDPTITAPVIKKVTAIKFAAKKYQIAAGKKMNLKSVVTVSPQDAANATLTWSIPKSSSKYASVNSKTGVVTTKKAGAGKTVTVTAAATDGSGKKATVKVQIMKNAVTKITVKKKTVTVKAGKKTTIKPTVKTNGSKVNKTLVYTSSNTKYATVNNKGVVTAKKAGAGKSVKITIKSTDGTNKSVKVTIKIKK